MRSSIFLSDLSVVDHAHIDKHGRIIGGSYNPGFMVSGEVDDTESVVVDFSTIKKDLKFHIDKHIDDIELNGFDHKLWIIDGYSDCEYTQRDGNITITTPAFVGTFPIDAIKLIYKPSDELFTDKFIGDRFAEHLEKCLAPLYPNVNLTVTCNNSTNVHLMDREMPLAIFNYSHGLKDSTSYGCQNLGHGHKSFIQHTDINTAWMVASELNNAVFINKDNIISDDSDIISIEYTTPRGYFKGAYCKILNHVIVLNTETTIEYIAEYVANRFGVSDFYISEGLSKGTYL